MIHLVVALRLEAEPLAEALDLEAPAADEASFPVFGGSGARLVVGGVGRAAAAAAAGYLEGRFPGEADLWINVGLAAHRELPLGTVVVGHKIVEQASSRWWYPTLLLEPDLPTATVRTVDRPMVEPPDEAVYEMEAAGFIATALRWVTSERVAIVKVISDHGVEHPRALDRAEVSRHLRAAAPAIVGYAESVEGLVRERRGERREGYLAAWRERYRFSFTEGHRLGRLANRAAVLGVSREAIEAIEASSAGEFMRRLEARLDAVALEKR